MRIVMDVTADGYSIVVHFKDETYFVDRCAKDEALGEIASWLYNAKPHYGMTVKSLMEIERHRHQKAREEIAHEFFAESSRRDDLGEQERTLDPA